MSATSPRTDRLSSTIRRREGIEEVGSSVIVGERCLSVTTTRVDRSSGGQTRGRGHAGTGTLDVWNFSLAPRIAAVHHSRLLTTAVRP